MNEPTYHATHQGTPGTFRGELWTMSDSTLVDFFPSDGQPYQARLGGLEIDYRFVTYSQVALVPVASGCDIEDCGGHQTRYFKIDSDDQIEWSIVLHQGRQRFYTIVVGEHQSEPVCRGETWSDAIVEAGERWRRARGAPFEFIPQEMTDFYQYHAPAGEWMVWRHGPDQPWDSQYTSRSSGLTAYLTASGVYRGIDRHDLDAMLSFTARLVAWGEKPIS